MKRFLVLIFLIVMLIPLQTQAQDGLSPEDIDRISRAVVQIVTIEDDDVLGSGSGTIVSASGLIYTNRHVIEDGDEFAILILDDPNEPAELAYFADLIAVYDQLDVAVLQITRDDRGRSINPEELELNFVEPTPSDATRGEPIYIFGYPGIGEGYLVLTQGNITTIRNGDIGGETMAVLYQTDAEISPGNSGGLAVNASGGIIGIPTEVVLETETGGRLGGILPFGAVLALEAAEEAGTNGGGGGLADAASSNPGSKSGSSGDNGSSSGSSNGNVTDEGFAESISMTCNNEVVVTNGVPITVRQIRPGAVYTATVIGMGGFDPVIGVLDPEGDVSTCSDDDPGADNYTVELPSTGRVSGGERDAQVYFSHNNPTPSDVTLVISGYEGAGGKFVVIIEGMDVGRTDAEGDLMQIGLTQEMADSGEILTVYMVARGSALDPMMGMLDEFDDDVYDVDDALVQCDDAGDEERCWGYSESLTNSDITISGIDFSGHDRDAMLSLDPLAAAESGFPYLTYVMKSYNDETQGEYLVVIHAGR